MKRVQSHCAGPWVGAGGAISELDKRSFTPWVNAFMNEICRGALRSAAGIASDEVQMHAVDAAKC